MDIQLRKIHFVQEFLRLNNEQLIHKLEDILKSEKAKLNKNSPKPYSVEDFHQIIDKAEDDAKNDRTKSAHDLKREIQSWN